MGVKSTVEELSGKLCVPLMTSGRFQEHEGDKWEHTGVLGET